MKLQTVNYKQFFRNPTPYCVIVSAHKDFIQVAALEIKYASITAFCLHEAS